MAEGIIEQVAHGPAQRCGLHTGLQRFEIEQQLIGLNRRAELRKPLIQRQLHRRLRITAAGEQQKLGCDPLQRIEIGLGPLLLRMANHAQTQAGERALEVVGDAGEHGGAIAFIGRQALHHRLEARRKPAHGATAG